jgi:hypothetical protein
VQAALAEAVEIHRRALLTTQAAAAAGAAGLAAARAAFAAFAKPPSQATALVRSSVALSVEEAGATSAGATLGAAPGVGATPGVAGEDEEAEEADDASEARWLEEGGVLDDREDENAVVARLTGWECRRGKCFCWL